MGKIRFYTELMVGFPLKVTFDQNLERSGFLEKERRAGAITDRGLHLKKNCKMVPVK